MALMLHLQSIFNCAKRVAPSRTDGATVRLARGIVAAHREAGRTKRTQASAKHEVAGAQV
jgi:hypothetical protein